MVGRRIDNWCGVFRACRWVCIRGTLPLLALGLSSCLARHDKARPKPPLVDPLANLQARANQLWTARMQEKWDTVFLFEDPRTRQDVDPAEFVTWCEAHEPFRVHSFQVGQAVADGELGWVAIQCRTSIRKFPGAQPQDVNRWEKWRQVDGQWYPVPRAELDTYPVSLALRDAAEEARLLDQFQKAWRARQERDWAVLYTLSDPQDRVEISEETFARTHDLIEFVSKQIRWVQVTGGEGTVRVAYRLKTIDPSLTKLPPQLKYVNERWVDRDGEWYLDLKSQ